jgi:hypothetical protein
MTDKLKNEITRVSALLLVLAPAIARADMGDAFDDILKPVGDLITVLFLMVVAMLGFALIVGVSVGVGVGKLVSRPKAPAAPQPTSQP